MAAFLGNALRLPDVCRMISEECLTSVHAHAHIKRFGNARRTVEVSRKSKRIAKALRKIRKDFGRLGETIQEQTKLHPAQS